MIARRSLSRRRSTTVSAGARHPREHGDGRERDRDVAEVRELPDRQQRQRDGGCDQDRPQHHGAELGAGPGGGLAPPGRGRERRRRDRRERRAAGQRRETGDRRAARPSPAASGSAPARRPRRRRRPRRTASAPRLTASAPIADAPIAASSHESRDTVSVRSSTSRTSPTTTSRHAARVALGGVEEQGGSGHGERDREGGARKPGARSPHRGPCGDAATGDQHCSCSHLDHSARWCLNPLSRWGSCAGRPLDWHVAPNAPNKGSGPLKPLTIHSKARFFAAVAALAALAMPAVADAKSRAPEVTVMTRNVFLGADLAPAINAPTIGQAIDGAGTIWNEMQSTRFADRASAARARDQAIEGRPRRPAGGRAVAQADAVRRRRAADQSDHDREAGHAGRAGLPRDPPQRAQEGGREVPGRRRPGGVRRRAAGRRRRLGRHRRGPTGRVRRRLRRAAHDARRDPRQARQQGEARQDAARVTSRRATSRPSAGSSRSRSIAAGPRSRPRSGARGSASSTPTWRRSATRRSATPRPRSSRAGRSRRASR